jgi:hypothetical protein
MRQRNSKPFRPWEVDRIGLSASCPVYPDSDRRADVPVLQLCANSGRPRADGILDSSRASYQIPAIGLYALLYRAAVDSFVGLVPSRHPVR